MYIAAMPDFNLPMTAQSGQCFRFVEESPGLWRLIAGDRLLRLQHLEGDRYAVSCDQATWQAHWHDYFDLDRDYAALLAAVPEHDHYLRAAVAWGRGLRILKQDAWEALVSFIISQNKNIPAIMRGVDLLCQSFGKPMEEGFFAFPRPEDIAGQPLAKLQACGLGYRSAYVLAVAELAAAGQLDLPHLSTLPDGELQQALVALPGVGPKVASCAMLFGFQRLEAFPVDVWIKRVLENRYHGKLPKHLTLPGAGILQQYLFCYERSGQHEQ